MADCAGDARAICAALGIDRLNDEPAARAKTEKDREEILAESPGDADDVPDGLQTLLSPVDAAVLSGELGAYLQAAMQDGLAPGVEGWWDDSCLIRPWGFSPAEVRGWLSDRL